MTKTITEVTQEQCSVELTRAANSREQIVGICVKSYATDTGTALKNALATYTEATQSLQ